MRIWLPKWDETIFLFIWKISLFFQVRLSERNGDLGKGILEIYKVGLKKWVPACVSNWNQNSSPTMVCSLLGYNSVNSSRITMRNTNQTLTPSSANSKDPNNIVRMYQRKKTNLIKEFGSCSSNENHPVIDLTCSNYGNYSWKCELPSIVTRINYLRRFNHWKMCG